MKNDPKKQKQEKRKLTVLWTIYRKKTESRQKTTKTQHKRRHRTFSDDKATIRDNEVLIKII